MEPVASGEAPVDPGFLESLKPDFPTSSPIQMVQVVMGPDAKPSQTIVPVGYRLSNSKESRIVQLKNDGFAFSHMAPYSNWDTLKHEAGQLWERFRRTARANKLDRCGLRYINRVDIPEQKIEIDRYFRFFPNVPEELEKNDVTGMSLNIQIPQNDLECMCTITQGLVASSKPEHVSFVLDIDLYRLGISEWKDTDVWSYFDRLRERKNEIFESCITDKTRELIK